MDKHYFLNQFKPVDKELKKQIIEFIQDKSIPLEDRWEVYTKTPKDLQTHDTCYPQLGEFEDKYFYGEISWYDDFYFERHETITLNDMDLFNRAAENKDSLQNLEPDELKEAEAIYKESCMQTGCHTATWDW